MRLCLFETTRFPTMPRQGNGPLKRIDFLRGTFQGWLCMGCCWEAFYHFCCLWLSGGNPRPLNCEDLNCCSPNPTSTEYGFASCNLTERLQLRLAGIGRLIRHGLPNCQTGVSPLSVFVFRGPPKWWCSFWFPTKKRYPPKEDGPHSVRPHPRVGCRRYEARQHT